MAALRLHGTDLASHFGRCRAPRAAADRVPVAGVLPPEHRRTSTWTRRGGGGHRPGEALGRGSGRATTGGIGGTAGWRHPVAGGAAARLRDRAWRSASPCARVRGLAPLAATPPKTSPKWAEQQGLSWVARAYNGDGRGRRSAGPRFRAGCPRGPEKREAGWWSGGEGMARIAAARRRLHAAQHARAWGRADSRRFGRPPPPDPTRLTFGARGHLSTAGIVPWWYDARLSSSYRKAISRTEEAIRDMTGQVEAAVVRRTSWKAAYPAPGARGKEAEKKPAPRRQRPRQAEAVRRPPCRDLGSVELRPRIELHAPRPLREGRARRSARCRWCVRGRRWESARRRRSRPRRRPRRDTQAGDGTRPSRRRARRIRSRRSRSPAPTRQAIRRAVRREREVGEQNAEAPLGPEWCRRASHTSDPRFVTSTWEGRRRRSSTCASCANDKGELLVQAGETVEGLRALHRRRRR